MVAFLRTHCRIRSRKILRICFRLALLHLLVLLLLADRQFWFSSLFLYHQPRRRAHSHLCYVFCHPNLTSHHCHIILLLLLLLLLLRCRGLLRKAPGNCRRSMFPSRFQSLFVSSRVEIHFLRHFAIWLPHA